MTIQISGSIAFDTIMVFDGEFKAHILPEQVHMLNVAFLVPKMRQEFGGCAANIGYSLAQLGSSVRLLGAVGRDGHAYLRRLRELSIDVTGVVIREDCFTPQAFITTDLADNQITAFHPGAMAHAHETLPVAAPGGLGIVSPNGRDAMMAHAESFAQLGIPFVFDPGQAMPVFDGPSLLALTQQASWLALNSYEAELMTKATGLAIEALVDRLQPHPQGGVVVTLGSQGVRIHSRTGKHELPALHVDEAIDPTGCGDAFRAGLLHGLEKGLSLIEAAELGVVLGGLKVQCRGGQNHAATPEAIRAAWASHHGSRACPV
jgi:adenosine kinase